jgi:hypothetical protein
MNEVEICYQIEGETDEAKLSFIIMKNDYSFELLYRGKQLYKETLWGNPVDRILDDIKNIPPANKNEKLEYVRELSNAICQLNNSIVSNESDRIRPGGEFAVWIYYMINKNQEIVNNVVNYLTECRAENSETSDTSLQVEPQNASAQMQQSIENINISKLVNNPQEQQKLNLIILTRIYPEFEKDFDKLVEKGYLSVTETGYFKWEKSKQCCGEYFTQGKSDGKNFTGWNLLAVVFQDEKIKNCLNNKANYAKDSRDFEELKKILNY